MIQQQG